MKRLFTKMESLLATATMSLNILTRMIETWGIHTDVFRERLAAYKLTGDVNLHHAYILKRL